MKADIIIIGADIVDLATAHKILTTNSGRKILILEKEDTVARHQTGHINRVKTILTGWDLRIRVLVAGS